MSDSGAVVRRFNRSYTQRIGVLEDSFLGMGMPLGPARPLVRIRYGPPAGERPRGPHARPARAPPPPQAPPARAGRAKRKGARTPPRRPAPPHRRAAHAAAAGTPRPRPG